MSNIDNSLEENTFLRNYMLEITEFSHIIPVAIIDNNFEYINQIYSKTFNNKFRFDPHI